jgi:putative ABC transport system permease protein
MNLATARSARRSKEVGMRKTLGAQRLQLVVQFLSESVMLCFVATLLSVLLASWLLPAFILLSGKTLELDLWHNPFLLILLFGIIVGVGITSGSYPALFLSSFKPVEVLKGKLAAGMNSSPLLRKGLVVFQFTISIVLIICTWMVYNQLDYLKNKNLGFDKAHVLVIKNTDNAITPRINTFKTELLKNTHVKQVAASFSVPGGLRPIVQVRTDAMSEEEIKSLALINIDFEYLKTMDIDVIEGRDFNPESITDSTEAIILNKAALAELEITGDPVGQVMYINNNPQTGEFDAKKIIGVIDNINFEPLYRKTEGAFFAPGFPFYNYIFVRIAPEQRAATIAFVEDTWASFAPDQPLDYSFLDENLNQLYLAEDKLGQLITYFSILAVIVACLGLFGLASFATDQRRKEIGIRKVLGSSNLEIVMLFFREYALIILIANIIAWPLAYYLTQQWMGNFVFNTGVSWDVFFLTALLVLVVAIVTVSAKAIKASLENPVKSLRSE